MKNYLLLFLFLISFSVIENGCENPDATFLLDVTNLTEEEVFLKANNQTFDRVLPGESKITEDEFEHNTLFHFIAVGLNTGQVRSEIFVTVTDRDFFEWIID